MVHKYHTNYGVHEIEIILTDLYEGENITLSSCLHSFCLYSQTTLVEIKLLTFSQYSSIEILTT